VNRRSRFNVLGVARTHSNDAACRGDSDPPSDAWQLLRRPISNQQEPPPERPVQAESSVRSFTVQHHLIIPPRTVRKRPLLPHPVRYRCMGQARPIKKWLAPATERWLRSCCFPLSQGGRSCIAMTTPRRPFEPTSKRRRGFPLASPVSSAATASSASAKSSSKSSAATTRAHAAQAAAFRRCCRESGRFDGAQGGYYVRDQ
jgi:hypothetical protein